MYIKKNNPENARTKSRKKRKKSITYYVIGQQNSSKKLESLDQSGILLCHTRLRRNKGVLTANPIARKKGLFFNQ